MNVRVMKIFGVLLIIALSISVKPTQADDQLVWPEQTPEEVRQNLIVLQDLNTKIFGFAEEVGACEDEKGDPAPCEMPMDYIDDDTTFL